MAASRQGQFDSHFLRGNGLKMFEIESVNRGHTGFGCALKQKRIVNRASLNSGSGRLSQQCGVFVSDQADNFEILQNVFLDA